MMCFVGAIYFWRLGDRWAAQRGKAEGRMQNAESRITPPASRFPPSPAFSLLSQPGTLNVPPATDSLTNHASRITNRFALRLSNTTAPIGQLQRNEHALLLENALLDTTRPVPAIPDHLRAHGDPGTYVVQARGPIDNAFRSLLQAAGAEIVSYIPNNAYLVRASGAVAQELKTAPLTQAVLPYEPYYKLKLSLLNLAVAQDPLPGNSALNVLVFADARQAARADLEKLGARILGDEESSPFGLVLRVRPPVDGLAAIAGLSGVQEVEWALTRAPANDMSRVRIGVAVDMAATNNYLGLSGSNVLVNINDSGVDATHPDLSPRVFGFSTNALVDPNGHGTHVAGIIASSGGQSSTVTNASGQGGPYFGTNNTFRGMAPAANLFVLPVGMFTKPFADGATLTWPSDSFLQITAAQTNAFISNNSWNYVGNDSQTYDLHAASYDAAVRDALPTVRGSQPLLLVFSAGNSGGGNSDGSAGNADTISTPGTAKNVITVGAIEQFRNITNQVWKCTPPTSTNNCSTNQPWLSMTDANDQVASFSSRGPVGVGIEGDTGRFKPDLVAPGTFVISTRSQQWDTNAYYNPTSHIIFVYQDVFLPTNGLYLDSIFVPGNAVQLNLTVVPNTNSPVPFPYAYLPMYLNSTRWPTNTDAPINTNHFSVPNDGGLVLDPVDAYWYFGIGNLTSNQVVCDLITDIAVTNDLGNYLQVLEDMNDSLGGYYRYESGTSMAAADVSGTLALMQEFFEQRLGRTNSPALMKAMLINGARSVGNLYDFNVTAAVVSQGWGVINLPATLPAALTNVTATAKPMVMADQSPTEALATGQSRTYKVVLSPDAQSQPLRVTLVWTDPPGNPVASIKLVNDLDLMVTNLDSPDLIYFGNDIGSGNDFNQAWDTNTVPNVDRVNNVESVLLSPKQGLNSSLSTNYSITVAARRVNVNAVTGQTNNVCQDYALVISSGDGLVTNAITFDTNAAIVSTSQPLVTVITNSFANSPGYSGGVLFNQRVGANPQLLGTNTIADANFANAVITLGVTNQWHFYVITNDTGWTNAAFLTFLPENLAITRMGVFEPSVDLAPRPEADIDLYVAPPVIPNNFGLTNLDPAVVVAADKSLSRGGTEVIVSSNATDGTYYIGVKSEDQQAAEYAIMGVFSKEPFGSEDQTGAHLIGIPTYQQIPDGTPHLPGVATIVAINVSSLQVRRVIATNIITHELTTDLLGNLSHGADFAVLNNHTCIADPTVPTFPCQTWTSYIYDDSDERNVGLDFALTNPHEQHTDGPGSLSSFAGKDGLGLWILSMVDNATNHIGTNVGLSILLERQPPLTGNGVTATILGGACRDDFIDVPANATSLTITVAVMSASAPVDFSLDLCPLAGGPCKSVEVTNNIGGSVTIDQTDLPPLTVGTYKVHTCNLDPVNAITVNIRAVFGFSQNTVRPILSATNTAPVPILDDAVTDIFLTNNIHSIISSLDVGLLVSDPRVSDLAITLISPKGTRVLLIENRGAATSNGLGIGTFALSVVTNIESVYTNNFDAAPVGLYAPGATFQGWSVLSNLVDVLDDYTCLCLSNHMLGLLDGSVSNSLPTPNAASLSGFNPYTLTYKVNHLPWLEGMVSWWPLDVDGSDIFGGLNGLLLGDVAFTTGASTLFFDDFSGPALQPTWQAVLPDNAPLAGYQIYPETYLGAPNYLFQTLGGASVLRMTNSLSPQTRRGWSSTSSFNTADFRYEVRFNTLDQSAATSIDAFIEIWMIDAANMNRYDLVCPYGANASSNRRFTAGSSIDNLYSNSAFSYQNNTWYRLVLASDAAHKIRASLCGDDGTELIGQTFNHGVEAFPSGFRIALSQAIGVPAGPMPVDVAVDYVKLTSTLSGKVNQAYVGDGVAARMVVPRCPELDLGLGRGFSIEGWINPNVNQLGGAAYDAQAAFSTNSNPNGLWTYAWSHGMSGTLNIFPRAGVSPLINNGVEVIWYDPANNNDFAPSIAVNTGGPLNNGNVRFDAGALIVAPGGLNTYDSYTHVIWTAPTTGSYSLVSQFKEQQYNINVDVNVLVNGARIFTSTITQIGVSRSFATNLILSAGSTVDFAVGPNGNLIRHATNTRIQASLTPLVAPSPLVEWNDPTNSSPQGVQLWLSGLPGTNFAQGALWANLWDTNLQPHIIATVANAITNYGWQHIALTYSTNSGNAILYTNGQRAATVHFPTSFVPRTSGDLYFGFHPPGLPLGAAFAGGLDEFSVYQRALSPCEVNTIFSVGARGKYGTNVLICPVATEVTLLTASGNQTYTFTNGITWTNAGPRWETNTISFAAATNPTAIVVRGLNPYSPADTNSANNLNAVVDDFVLATVVTNTIDGLLHFTEDTNLATLPIKFASTPYVASNFPPVLIFSNGLSSALAGLYDVGATITGIPNSPAIGTRDWTVTNGPVTVVSNAFFDVAATNWLAMATGAVQCLLPTTPGHRYELSYNLRGPCAVGWWNGSVDPLSQRAQDLISGNNGAFFFGATNVQPGFVGTQMFRFDGAFTGLYADPDIFPDKDIDDPANKIELADPPQLRFTNAFTLEGWINPALPPNPPGSGHEQICPAQQIFFRGYPAPFDCGGQGDPYWLALEPTADLTRYELHFHIADAQVGSAGADVLTTNGPIVPSGGSNSGWWHIAAVFDKPFTNIVVGSGTNAITITTNALRLYVNGVCVASNYTTISPYQDLDPALSPGVAIGGRCGYDWTQPYQGYMDEITAYARALTGPELAAIATNGPAGKADLAVAPAQSLAKLSVSVDGMPLATAYGDNSQWTTHTVQFTALETNAVVLLQSLLPGTLVDGITLTEVAPELYYLPEVSLSDIYGEDAFGVWTLEIWDNRAGGSATNLAQLLEWELNFGLAPSNPPPVITLSHGIPYTNSLPAKGIQYFIVPVPQWATLATNILQFANQVRTTSPLPVSVLFDQTNYPAITNPALIGPFVSSGTTVLATNTIPPLIIGQPYYLAVTNPNPVAVTFALEVAFDITTLTNCLVTTNFVGPAGIPRYFQFDVPTNGQPADLPAQAVSLWLSGARSNLTLVVSEHLPLPDLDHFDYISQQPSTNNEVVMLVTNSTPFPIQTNRWYIGVFNTTATNVPFAIQACLNTDYPIIIPLTNGIPFDVVSTASAFAARPGPPQRMFFDFLISNFADGVLFELYNLSGDADLVLQQAVPPTMAPYFDGSFAVGLTPEQIVVRANPAVPDLRGHWYLGVYNNELTNVTYTIRAVLPNSDRLLLSGQPFRLALTPLSLPHGLLLSWNSVEGEHYFVQYTPSIVAPIMWTNIGFVVATTPLTTFEVLLVPAAPSFYRVVQVFSGLPILHIQLLPGNQVRLSWSTAYPGYTLQSKLGLLGSWAPAGLPVNVVGTEYVAFDTIGPVPKYYRLFK
jgi:subtilisin-like proprotein convertase family protein